MWNKRVSHWGWPLQGTLNRKLNDKISIHCLVLQRLVVDLYIRTLLPSLSHPPQPKSDFWKQQSPYEMPQWKVWSRLADR
jgi:hypothetical protein